MNANIKKKNYLKPGLTISDIESEAGVLVSSIDSPLEPGTVAVRDYQQGFETDDFQSLSF